MPEEINMQPRLYVSAELETHPDEEEQARTARLKSLQQRIARRPDAYLYAFNELDTGATAETLDTHDDATRVRNVSQNPKDHIKEYFTKRDDTELALDKSSDEAIFGTEEFRRLSKASREKTAILKKMGVMKSVLEADPGAREASNAVRRYIFGQYVGRVILWKEQQGQKGEKRAG